MNSVPDKKPKAGWLNLVVDYGPVLLFFMVYKHFSPSDKEDSVGEVLAVIKGTGTFMVAAVIALVVSKWKLKHISPMLWLSTALIVFFGAVTILLHDPFYIQIKPTAIYLIFGISLLIGVVRKKALLKTLLSAALNEGFRYYLSFGGWLQSKLYVFLPLSFVFTFAHMPMLLRHGMGADAEDEVITNPPHE
jgi:intracellular septation protein